MRQPTAVRPRPAGPGSQASWSRWGAGYPLSFWRRSPILRVAATDLGTIGEPDRMMRILAAVPACSELNVGVATQQILANFWMHNQGFGAARAGLLV